MSDKKKEKTYIKGVFVREKTFDNGSIINVAINIEQFIQELGKYETKCGYAFVSIHKRKEVSDKGFTHYVTLDDFKTDKEGLKEHQSVRDDPFAGGDDVPF